MKRFISIILSLFLLVPLLNITSYGADFQEIHLGETVYAVPDEETGINYYTFVPDKTDYYVFSSKGDFDTVGYIFDSSINVVASNDDYEDHNFYICCKLTGGEEYILATALYEQSGGEVYTVSITKGVAAENIILFHGGEVTGYVGQTLMLEAIAEPSGSYLGECTWTVSDKNVATIYETYENYVLLYFTGAGKATVNVKSKELGLSDQFNVTSVEIPEISLDERQYLSFGVMGGTRYFSYTPDVSGMYSIYTIGAYDTTITSYNNKWNVCKCEDEIVPGSGDHILKMLMVAGERYYFEISAYGAESPDCEFAVSPSQSPEGIYVYNDEGIYWGYEGETIDLSIGVLPFYALSEGCRWVSDDPSVVKIEENAYGDGCSITFLSEGKASVSAQSSSGLTDTVMLECVSAETIELNERVSVSSIDGNIPYKFIPCESGYYAFMSEGSNMASGAIYDESWNFINGSETGFYAPDDFVIHEYLEAGKAYYLEAEINETKMFTPFDMLISKCTAAVSIGLSCGDELYGYVGDEITLDVVFDSKTARGEKCDFILSDKSVAEIRSDSDGVLSIYLKNAGETTITVTAENGLTATCNVTVSKVEYEQLTLDEQKQVNAEKYREAYFSFIPSESGEYTVFSTGEADTYCSLWDNNQNEIDFDDDSGKDMNFSLEVSLVKGRTYIFSTGVYSINKSADYGVKIVKSKEAEKVNIDSDKVANATVGQTLILSASFAPDGAKAEEVYWEVDGRDILGILYEDGLYCGVYVMSEGIATLNVYTESGLYNSITVVCGSVMTTKGDVNGDSQLNAIDANVLRRHVAGAYDNINLITTDMNNDAVIDSRDSNLLKRLVAGR